MIALRKISLTRGKLHLRCIDLEVPQGAYAVVMGPTGCGKTSLLECIAGLVKPDSGSVMIHNKDVTKLPAAAREVGYVPQDAALFTGLSVRQNIGFALNIRGVAESSIRNQVDELAKELEISHLLDRSIRGLSGGERQRVALGRAMIIRPKVMLLDEPFASLDEISREAMCDVLQRIHRETKATFLHVTHSVTEAERLATIRFDEIFSASHRGSP
jgi:molybdate/tungstate transport system ATP-binding protein